METIREHFESSSLAEAIPPRSKHSVLTLEHNMTVAEALKALAHRKILSAPVVISDSLEDMENEGFDRMSAPALIGWVDINDVLRGLISHLKDKHHGRLPTSMLLLMTELESEGKVFSRKPLITLTGGEDHSLLYKTEAGESLMTAIRELLLGEAPGVGGRRGRVTHRIAIFDEHGSINQIVSQLDIIRYICVKSRQLLGPLGDASIQDLGIGAVRKSKRDDAPQQPAGDSPVSPQGSNRPPLVTVGPDMSTLLALDHMLSLGVSGAPVVTNGGEMVANLSISDLRCIRSEHLGMLALPVAEFVALMHHTTYLGYSQRSGSGSGSGAAAGGGGSGREHHAFFAGSPRPAADELRQVQDAGGPRQIPGHISDDSVKAFTVQPTSTLNQVLHMLGDNHIHRVYVCEGGRVRSVITPTDILRWAAGEGTASPPAAATAEGTVPTAGIAAARPVAVS